MVLYYKANGKREIPIQTPKETKPPNSQTPSQTDANSHRSGGGEQSPLLSPKTQAERAGGGSTSSGNSLSVSRSTTTSSRSAASSADDAVEAVQ